MLVIIISNQNRILHQFQQIYFHEFISKLNKLIHLVKQIK